MIACQKTKYFKDYEKKFKEEFYELRFQVLLI